MAVSALLRPGILITSDLVLAGGGAMRLDAARLLARAHAIGFRCLVIVLDEALAGPWDASRVLFRLRAMASPHGARIDGCLHLRSDDGSSLARTLVRVAGVHRLDIGRSFALCGDARAVAAARSAAVTTCLVGGGDGSGVDPTPPDHRVADLDQAWRLVRMARDLAAARGGAPRVLGLYGERNR